MAVSQETKDKIALFVAKYGWNVLYTNEPEQDVFDLAFDGSRLAELIQSIGNSSTIRRWDSIPREYQDKYPQLFGQIILHVW